MRGQAGAQSGRRWAREAAATQRRSHWLRPAAVCNRLFQHTPGGWAPRWSGSNHHRLWTMLQLAISQAVLGPHPHPSIRSRCWP